MGFEVSVMKFEGPLDLLLNLIHENQMDIFDLDMSVLTDQYIEYLHKMEKMDIEVESEYLVELSRLIEIKSQKMLPKPEIEGDEVLMTKDLESITEFIIEPLYQEYSDCDNNDDRKDIIEITKDLLTYIKGE